MIAVKDGILRKLRPLFVVKLKMLRYNELMDEISRYAVGVDVGTSSVRAVVASVNREGALNVIGYGEAPNSGMRKGVVANLTGPAQAIDRALAEVEQMSGYEVNSASLSINGAQIVSTRTEGMIAVGANEHEITGADLTRVENVALQGRIPANQEILQVVPLQYVLDGQHGIKDPLGMLGSRLEMQANVVSTLSPSYVNLVNAVEGMKIPLKAERVVPSVVASARAVLTERQRENGVAVIDIGAATTGVAVYEENDLQYIGVVPIGSNNITNDLAVMLAVDTEVAEELKRRFATGNFGANENSVVIRWRGKDLHFERYQIDDVVRARLEEIMEHVRKELRRAKYEQKLPEGVVLTGGGARMREIDKFVRETLLMSVKIGSPVGLSGVADAIEKPEFAAAVGLMLLSADGGPTVSQKVQRKKSKKKEKGVKGDGGWVKKIFGKF